MKTTAFIPIKLNNERFPGKNTKPFSDGTPLCHLIQRTLLHVSEVDEIVIFCSNESICEYLLPGVKFLKRPAFLDTQKILCSDLIRVFMQMYESDLYIMANATSPFIQEERYRECICAVQSGEYDSAFACERLSDFLWYHGKPLNYTPRHIPRTQDLTPAYRELSSPYVFTRAGFERNGSRIGSKPFMCECGKLECVDIDYPEDFIIADMIYAYINKQGNRHEI